MNFAIHTPSCCTVAVSGEMEARLSIVLKDGKTLSETFAVPPVIPQKVVNERQDYFPVYDPNQTWFCTGTSPNESTFDAVTEIVVKSGTSADANIFKEGRDYVFSRKWNRIGRTPDSAIKPPVYLSYQMIPQRIDSVVLKNGAMEYRAGTPKGLMPRPPELGKGEIRLANIYLPVGTKRLADTNLYPIMEKGFPPVDPVADRLLPDTMKKLRNGGGLRILAWGDSITEGYGKLKKSDRWQDQFVRRLRERFPRADIELVTNAWGGHRTRDFLDAPADSPRNYDRHVLGVRPDLIISEFHNDLGMNGEQFSERYRKLIGDFKKIHAEWIIVTPNWVSEQQNPVSAVPEHIRLLRKFAEENHIALADAAAKWGGLWKQGIPYLTLTVNQFNHPDRDGMKLYADTVMDVFPVK